MSLYITPLVVTAYILNCGRVLAMPWRFFQINAQYFSRHKGIYSKLAIDELIPAKWKLAQQPLQDAPLPGHYPVFLKPEWGENARGIERADNEFQFHAMSRRLLTSEQQYMVQQAAPGHREFEIYTVYDQREQPSVITITEAVNNRHRYPVNSIKNSGTRYLDISGQFAREELAIIAAYKREIGRFGHSRLCVRAESIAELLAGRFHVIELNLFTPMPINLMDRRYSLARQLRFIGKVSYALARATKALDDSRYTQPVFSRMMFYSHWKKIARLVTPITNPSHEKTETNAVRADHQKVHGGLQ